MNGPIPKVRKHGRIKPRYNPVPTAREKAFHLWLLDNYPCACGCEGRAEVVHHILSKHRLKRWRRDHEMVVPMTSQHHVNLHLGNSRAIEAEWWIPERAEELRKIAYEEGVL